jgi:hypothetical protein
MGSKVICLIDDRPVLGTDWTLPKSQLVQATVRIGSLVVDLDVSCMFNPWIDKPDARDFTVESVYGGLLIRGNFSDAAGRYTAEWLVIQNSSVRTRLEYVGRVKSLYCFVSQMESLLISPARLPLSSTSEGNGLPFLNELSDNFQYLIYIDRLLNNRINAAFGNPFSFGILTAPTSEEHKRSLGDVPPVTY